MHEQTNLMKDIHIKLDATSYLCISVPLSCCMLFWQSFFAEPLPGIQSPHPAF